jgi:tripartite-type tricarboxylate transporter receptor subunit TctC
MSTGTSHRRRQVLKQAAAMAALPALASLPARAADAYPSRAIRLVVPYPPGGSTDILARAFAEPFAKALGQPVVIENRPGGSTNIGLEIAAASPADGYTLYFGTSGLAANPHFGPVPSVDVFKDIAPVSLIATMPFLVAAHPGLEANTPRELVDLAKARPGKLMISSASLDTQIKMLNKRADIELLHVPYKGGAQATNDAIAGHVNMVFALLPVLLPQIKAGKLKAIGITAPERSPAAPDIAAFSEIGIEGPPPSWFALFVPAGTPTGAVQKLNQAAVAAAHDKDMVGRMLGQGIEIRSSTPGELADLLERDYSMNARLLKELG